jgi:hypothetical protein
MVASNYGDNVDVWAPGDNIPIHLPAERDYVDNIRDPITNELLSSEDVDFFALDTNEHKTVDRTQGTSFASPIVAGVAAMLKFWKPDLNVRQFLTILYGTGSLVTDPSFLDSANKGQRFLNALEAVRYPGINAQKYQVIKGTYTNNQIYTNDKVYRFTPNNPFLYADLAGKSVTVLGWIKGDEINILQMREANQTLSYNGKSIPIVQPYGQTVVSTGDKIAIPMTDALLQRLQNIDIRVSSGERLTYYEIVNHYAIYGVPPEMASSSQNVVARDLSTGETLFTFEQALYRAALALNLNPITPPDALMLPNSTSYPPFIYDNTSRDVNPGDIVAAALYGLSKNDTVTVTVNGQNMPIYDQKDGYLSFKIQGGLSGTQNVSISTNNQSVTYHDALNILGGVSNNQKIAFIEKNLLYTVNSDGSNLKPIAQTSDLSLSWSPDKSKIAYISDEAFTLSYVSPPSSKLVVTDSDGTSKIKVSKGGTNTRDSYPVWSYDGTKIAFFRHDYSSDKAYLCTIDINDSSENILLEIPKYTTSLSWSRDNKKISYVVQNPDTLIQELHVFDGTTDRKLFDNVADF